MIVIDKSAMTATRLCSYRVNNNCVNLTAMRHVFKHGKHNRLVRRFFACSKQFNVIIKRQNELVFPFGNLIFENSLCVESGHAVHWLAKFECINFLCVHPRNSRNDYATSRSTYHAPNPELWSSQLLNSVWTASKCYREKVLWLKPYWWIAKLIFRGHGHVVHARWPCCPRKVFKASWTIRFQNPGNGSIANQVDAGTSWLPVPGLWLYLGR